MKVLSKYSKPTKKDQKLAGESYPSFIAAIENLESNKTEMEIEIDGNREKIVIPVKALQFFGKILKAMSQGKPFSIVPQATEVTTQYAAEMLGCSRPHLIKLLEEGKIEYTKVGRHRRIKYEDVVNFKKEKNADRKKRLIEMMHHDEELGLYDT